MTTQESREQEIKRLNAEKVKQIALCHFYSYYVRHNMSDMLAYVGEDVTWLGSQSDFVAHNRQEFENLLEREIKKVPKQCVMKVISADVSQVSGNCYQVTGELELRLPVQDNVYYTNLRFSMMICKEDGKFSIVSIHTSTIGKSVLWDDTQVLKERQKRPLTQKKFLQIWRKNILDKYKVKVNTRAIRELDHIYEYIANEKLAPENAKGQVDRIKKAILGLETFLQSHQERNEGRYAAKGYHQLLIDNYIAIFCIDEPNKTVYVVTIQYQGRNL